MTDPLVSIDFNGDRHSSSVDSLETAVLEGKLVRVLSWYDNEWGFSSRMVDTAGGDGGVPVIIRCPFGRSLSKKGSDRTKVK